MVAFNFRKAKVSFFFFFYFIVCFLLLFVFFLFYQSLKFIPHIPSLTREDRMFIGRYPAFVQWNLPFGQAEVPGKIIYI